MSEAPVNANQWPTLRGDRDAFVAEFSVERAERFNQAFWGTDPEADAPFTSGHSVREIMTGLRDSLAGRFCRRQLAYRRRAAGAGRVLHAGLLTDVPVGSESFYEEFLGPVAEIYKANSEQEAIDLANNSRYGLGGAVFSQDVDRAKNVAAQIDTGMVHVNLGQAFNPALPFGGIKRSGFGRELSVLAMDEFVNKQTFYVND